MRLIGPGGEGKNEPGQAGYHAATMQEHEGQGHQTRRASDSITSRRSAGEEHRAEGTAAQPDYEEVDKDDLGEALLGADYDSFLHNLLADENADVVKFSLTAAGMPTEDPVPHLTARLGESLHEDHVHEIMGRVRHLSNQLRKLDKMKMPNEDVRYKTPAELKASYSHFDAPINAFLASAKGLHLTDLQPIEGAAPDELGEEFGRRRKKASVFARRRRGKQVKKGPVTRRRRCLFTDGFTKLLSCKMGDMVKAGVSALKKVFGFVKMLASKFLAMIAKLLKSFMCKLTGCAPKNAKQKEELGEAAGKDAGVPMLMKIPVIAKLMSKFVQCSDLTMEETRVKCSDQAAAGPKNKDGTSTCSNGGGVGQNWLWFERVNTRKPSATWFGITPDASECHDQLPEKRTGKGKGTYGDGTKCGKGREHMCEYNLGGPPKKLSDLNLAQTGQFSAFRPRVCSDKDTTDTTILGEKLKISPFCSERFGVDPRSGTPYYNSTESPAARKFYSGWDYNKYRHRCEHDNRCVLYDLSQYGNPQGRYRCAPRVHSEDPRYWLVSKEDRYMPDNKGHWFKDAAKGKGHHDEGRVNLNADAALGPHTPFQIQTALAKWQRSTQPYTGGDQGVKKASFYPLPQFHASKAHKHTGDMCINYGWNDTYGEETQGYMPRTRVRCMSGMYRSFSDPTMAAPCLGLSLSGMGKFILDMLAPILKMIPGNLYASFGPAMAGIIGMMIGDALDVFLARGLMIPLIGPYIGMLYELVMSTMKQWVNVDLRNVITNALPGNLVRSYLGAQDLAIDAAQDRMARVYHGKACGPKVAKYGTGCPDAIPIRSGALAASRAGDITFSAVETLFPGRQRTKVHTEYAALAFIKMSICLKVPICDTEHFRNHTTMYSPGGDSLDCSGRGTCLWNMEKGNHCKCDKGFTFLTACMRCCEVKPNESEKTWKARCGLKAHGGCSTQIPKKERKPPQKRNLKRTTGANKRMASSWSKEKVAKAMDKVHKEDAAMALTEAALQEGQKAMQRGNKAYTKAKPKIEALKAAARATKAAAHPIMDQPEQGAETLLQENEEYAKGVDAPTHTGIMTKGAGLSAMIESMGEKGNHAFKSYGEGFVSKRCVILGAGECGNQIGCRWQQEKAKADSPGAGWRCEDAAELRCSVKKKIIDCLTYKSFAPVNVASWVDASCGKNLLKQRKKLRRVCRFGTRIQEPCNDAFDCPITDKDLSVASGWVSKKKKVHPPINNPTLQQLRAMQHSVYDDVLPPRMKDPLTGKMVNTRKRCANADPSYLLPEAQFLRLLNSLNPNAIIKDGKRKGLVAFSRCWSKRSYDGCAGGVFKSCKAKSFDVQGAMAL